MKYDYSKQIKLDKEKDITSVAWVVTILVLLASLLFLLSISGAGSCEDIVAGECVPK